MRVVLDALQMEDRETVHAYLKEKLSLPDYYGNNLDALWDCLSEMDGVEIVIENRKQAQGYFERVHRVLRDATEENAGLSLTERKDPYEVCEEDDFFRLLTAWYRVKHRELPWRSNPTPYHVWVSEIMLQQTRVEAVKDYYARFMKRLPDVRALAEVSDDELMKLWEGLGYYSRARNLKKCAQVLVAEYDAKLPCDEKKLEDLPGIGPYTAGAIGSIAFHLPCAAVDGNVLRVMSRLAGNEDDITMSQTKTGWKNYLERLYTTYTDVDSGEMNQALMELGATVCIPNGTPRCADCPLEDLCVARAEGRTEELPVRAPKKPRKDIYKTVLLLFSRHRVMILRRPEEGLLADLYEYPNVDTHMSADEVLTYLKGISPAWKNALSGTITVLPQAKHIFTHLEWHMIGYAVNLDTEELERLAQDYQEKTNARMVCWADRAALCNTYAVPGAFEVYTGEAMKQLEDKPHDGK